jgi:hypothetical protein
MGESAVLGWLGSLLVEYVGFSESEALDAATKCALFRNYEHPEGVFSWQDAAVAATAITATPLLANGADWWQAEGQICREWLIQGKGAECESRIAETLAPPAPDGWDPNWPEAKRFRVVDIPQNASVGDEFLVGNGEGVRGLFRVAERDGLIGAELVSSSYSLDGLDDEAYDKARSLFALDED